MFRTVFLAALIFGFSGAALAANVAPAKSIEAPCPGNLTFDCLLADLVTRIDAKNMTTDVQAMGLANTAALVARNGTDEMRKEVLNKYDQLPRNLESGVTKSLTTPAGLRENHYAFYRAQLWFTLGRYDEALALLRALQTKDVRFDPQFLPQFVAVETLVQAGKLDDAIRLVKDTGQLKFKAATNVATFRTGEAERPDGEPAEQLIKALLVEGRVKDAEDFYNYLTEDDLFMTDPHQLGVLFARYYEQENTPANMEKQKRFCTAVAEQLTWPGNLKKGKDKEGGNFEYERLTGWLKNSYCFKNNPQLLANINLETAPLSAAARKDMADLKAGTRKPQESRALPPAPDLKAGIDDCLKKAARDSHYYVPCMSRLLDEEARVQKTGKASEFDKKYPPFG